MGGFVRAIAVDLDGTLTEHEVLSATAMSALAEVSGDGVAAVLVTGRILSELEHAFPGLAGRFDAVVAENGAVLAVGEEVQELAAPVEDALGDALRQHDLPFRRGRVLLAGDAVHAPAILETVGALGLDCQIVRNRGALMVLPAGISKGTGLRAALAELGISHHNALAVGDAENDLALLEAAEVGVAVANAVPSLRMHADLVLEEPNGDGLAALLSGPILSGERAVRPERRRLPIGRDADGAAVTVPGAQANVLVCGATGAGKSHLAGLLVERWIAAGYVVLVIDMEGEHVALHRLRTAIVLAHRPTARELLALLGQRSLSVVLDLSELEPDEKLDYLGSLTAVVEPQRAATGLPHWIVVDEAHATLRERGVAAAVFRPADRGYCLVTYRPEELCTAALAAIDVTITLTGTAVPAPPGTAPSATATIREAGGAERSFVVAPRRTPHVRHRRKYATEPLAPHRRFGFRNPDGTVLATAEDLAQFSRLLEDVDTSVVAHHLEHGDFSRWIGGTIRDQHLGGVASAIEREVLAHRRADILRARQRLLDEIENRYLAED
jgi:hydroxymethylpyrimidine pyrophosphatase-like HAD family hydrolase